MVSSSASKQFLKDFLGIVDGFFFPSLSSQFQMTAGYQVRKSYRILCLVSVP